ncbi:MAG TPA: NifU family protein [Pirellulales bacterium]|jgi:Fe-S cluster biogenesis protein NfuA
MTDQPKLADSIERIDQLIDEIESVADPAAQSQMRELVQCILDYHGAAVGRMMQLLQNTPGETATTVERLAGDELVASLLLLHGCHPEDFAERVSQALSRVRPMLAAHGGDVELLRIADGVVQLRLLGNCHGCPSSTATMRAHVEQAIYELAPETVGLEVEGAIPAAAAAPAGFVPLEQLSWQ